MKYYSAAFLVLVSFLTISSPAAADEYINYTSVATDVFKTIWSPPHRVTEITTQGEIEKAKIHEQGETERARITAEATKSVDKIAPTLAEWGVTRASCTHGGVFINGLSSDTVCINPTAAIPAGYYSYTPDRKLLVRMDGNSPPATAPAPAPVTTAAPVATAVPVVTPAPAATPSKNTNLERGF